MTRARTLHSCRRMAAAVALLLCAGGLFAQVKPPIGGGTFPFGGSRSSTSQGMPSENGLPPSADDNRPSDTSAAKGLVFTTDTPDSVLKEKVFYFHHVPFGVKINELHNPSLDPTSAQYHDPLDAHDGNYTLSTGVLGHPHIRLYPTFATGLEPALQADEHVGYAKTPSSVRLYQTLTPYTLLSYSNSLNKDNNLRVAHTQNIMPGWNVSFDYNLLNPEGAFAHSAARNHYLDATSNYFSPDSRLQAVAGFIFQRFNVDENGGLADDSYFTSGRQSNQGGIPMNYASAGSTHLRHTAFGRVSYNLVRQVTTYRTRDSLVLRHETVESDSMRTVLDTIEVTDTLRTRTPRVFNAGVVGLDVRHHRSKRAAYLPDFADSTLWSLTEASLYWTNDAYPDHKWTNPLKVTLGITPRYLHTHLLGDTLSGLSLLNPFAKAELSLRRMTITAQAQLDNSLHAALDGRQTISQADRYASLEATMPLGRDSNEHNWLTLGAHIQRSLPELRMLVARLTPGGDPLVAQGVGRINLRYDRKDASGLLPSVHISLDANRLSHHFWYDTVLMAHQGDTPFWLMQASIAANLHFGIMRLDMQHLFQYSTDVEQMEVPLWSTKNSLYADMHLFRRALRMQVGIDVRYHTLFDADSYDPASGLFLSHDDVDVGGYIWGDVFVNLQVKRATISVKAGHVNALWESHPAYLLLPHYPGQSFGLSWSLTWHFFD